MKKLFLIIAIALGVCVAMTSCEYDSDDISLVNSNTHGVATISVNVAKAVTRADYPLNTCDIRIYKVSGTAKELIRHYFSKDDMPADIWLLAGKYKIEVTLGSKAVATFTEPSYYGDAEFNISAGQSTAVKVDCRYLNTLVAVKYDADIANLFDQSYRTDVSIAGNSNAMLTYTANSGNGYFMLSNESRTLDFNFYGQSSDSKIGYVAKTISKTLDADKLAGYLYTLTLKYSADEQGYISFDFELEIQADAEPDTDIVGIPTTPGPVIDLEEGNMGGVTEVTEGLTYNIKASTQDITKVTVSVDTTEYTFDMEEYLTRADAPSGITFTATDSHNVTIAFEQSFFDTFTGGDHTISLKVATKDDPTPTAVKSKIRIQGVSAFEPTWADRGKMVAYAFGSPSKVEIKYRKASSGGSWTTLTASQESESVYSAYELNFAEKTAYEVQLVVNDEEMGAVITGTTKELVQVPNSGFEEWSGTKGSRTEPRRPYANIGNQWWDSGNEGSKVMGMTLTSDETDKPANAAGTYSAKLASSSTLGVLATGNIFIGKFVGTHDTTKGVVRFGHSFDFTYRPKALKFWYKNKVGKIDTGSGAPGVNKNDQDVQQIYILLCKMDGPHVVDTGNTSTFLNLTNGIKTIDYCNKPIEKMDSENSETFANNVKGAHVIGYGVWEKSESVSEWTLETLNITYNPEYEGEVPTWLMITAAANKYGDYYMGCKSNELCLDEMELVY